MSAMSKEQFAEINAKLDKILQALNELEIVTDEDGAEIDSDGEDEDAEEIIEDDSESEDEE
jgi:hypothetical protein